MRIVIAAVGKLKERHWRDASDEYLKRMKPYAHVEIAEVSDRDLSNDEVRAVAQEGETLLRAIPDDTYVITLEIEGKGLSSEEFSKKLSDLMVSGRSSVAFVIGGAAGLAPDVRSRADERLSLGTMTLPHQMVRVVLLEQIYRAFRIMRNEPYHR